MREAVEYLNLDQAPIAAVDQRFYTVTKQIQWNWPETHGENHFIIMFGRLHIEMTAPKILGNLLEGSRWVGALVQAEVATSGTTNSFLVSVHVTRT